MSQRCAPGPINTCTLWWERVSNRLLGHVRIHPQGGLKEKCDPDCTDEGQVGLGICLVGDPDPENPTDLTESGLRISEDGCLYVAASTRRKRKVFSAQFSNGVSGNTLLMDETFQLDATNAIGDECWRVCIDVCSANVFFPTGSPAQVVIPAQTIDTGGNPFVTIPQQVVDVIDAPPVVVDAYLTVGDRRCWAYSANRNESRPWSGTLCTEVTVPAGTVVDVPIVSEIIINPDNAPSNSPSASSGEITVIAERVACAEDC